MKNTRIVELRAAHANSEIYGCPGRWLLADQEMPLIELQAGALWWKSCLVPSAPDRVQVIRYAEGGIISYVKGKGRYIHTVNTEEGFRRKLAKLGITDTFAD